MKRKDLMKQLRGLSSKDLQARACGLAEELMKLRFRKVGGQSQSSHRYGEAKREIARIKTLLSGLRISANANQATVTGDTNTGAQ